MCFVWWRKLTNNSTVFEAMEEKEPQRMKPSRTRKVHPVAPGTSGDAGSASSSLMRCLVKRSLRNWSLCCSKYREWQQIQELKHLDCVACDTAFRDLHSKSDQTREQPDSIQVNKLPLCFQIWGIPQHSFPYQSVWCRSQFCIYIYICIYTLYSILVLYNQTSLSPMHLYRDTLWWTIR